MIDAFFENISFRLKNENALSDVTWALCNASPKFREFFLRYFFSEIRISDDMEIIREFSNGKDSRPDFYIKNGNDVYLIENKISDTNYHFEQYEKAFGVTPEKFGCIANYIIPPIRGKKYQLRTWEELYKKTGTLDISDKEERSLIEGYRTYLKSVCNIIEFTKPMNIEGIYSLYQLMELFNKLCNRDEEKFIIKSEYQNRKWDNGHSDHKTTGIIFKLNVKSRKLLEAWGWIGIDFSKEIPIIYIGFWKQEGWGKPVYDLLIKLEKPEDLKYSSVLDEKEGTIWFEYKYEENFNQHSLDEQTNLLKDFMDEVLNYVCDLSSANEVE